MIYLLHIDTATDTGTVAISADGVITAFRVNTDSRNHAAVINMMIGDVLAEAGCSLADVHGVVVCGGPGSYTGLRIGMATAKGLCYALDKPLFVDSRLTLLAHHQYLVHTSNYQQYVALIKARENEYFIAVYDGNFTCLLPPQHIIHDQLPVLVKNTAHTLWITDADPIALTGLAVNDLDITNDIATNLSSWGVYAFDQFKCNMNVNLATAEPFYLKQVYTHK